jgi:MioC protein
MSSTVGIFVATMTGLAEMCAEEVAGALDDHGISSQTLMMDALGADAVDGFDTVIIISSTYGHGDIPDNGQAFFEALSEATTLSDKCFAVFALGDRTYSDTFCHAGEQWDKLMEAKSAKRLMALERHDASSGTLAEDEAGGWASRWAASLKQAA